MPTPEKLPDLPAMDAQTTGCAGAGACFWVGGTGNWSDGSHWANASNGTNTGSIPTSADAVYFDPNSGGGTSTVDIGMEVASLNATGYEGTIILGAVTLADDGDFMLQGTLDAASGIVNVAGNWDSHLGTFMKGTSTVWLSGMGKTLKTNGTAGFYNLRVYNHALCGGPTASYTMASALEVSNQLLLGGYEVCGGSLTTAGYNITGWAEFASIDGWLLASSSALTFRSVELSFGGMLSLTTGSLVDTGGWDQGPPYPGGFRCGTSTVTFTGSASPYWASPFYNLTVSGSFNIANRLTVLNHLTVTGNLFLGYDDGVVTFNSLETTSGSIYYGGITVTHFSVADNDPAAQVTFTPQAWTSNDYAFTYTDTKAADTITFTISSLTPGWNFTITSDGTYFGSGKVTADGLAIWTMLGSDAGAVEVTVGGIGLRPSAPRNLQATPGDDPRIILTWQAPSPEGGSAITSYKIYGGTSSGGEFYLATVGNVLTYTDAGLTNGIAYYYQVSAVNAIGEGRKSDEVSAIPSAAYPIQDLGTLGGASSVARSINDLGQVVGESGVASGQQHAFLWQDGVMTDLGTLGGGCSGAFGVNNHGQVVGYSCISPDVHHAFLWQDGVMTDLGTLGGSWSAAVGINDLGQVVGVSNTVAGWYHAFLWQDGVMTDLGTLGGLFSDAWAVNDLGQVVGNSGAATGMDRAVLWHDGVMTVLGGGYIEPRDINDLGQIVGGAQHAFLWQDGVMTDLGTLGGSLGEAYGINDFGQVVGFYWSAHGGAYAFLWQDGVMTDLGTLGGTCGGAYAINDLGQVVGESGPAFGMGHATLWSVPSLAPPPVATLDEALNGDGVPLADGASTVSNAMTFSFAAPGPTLVAGFTCTLDGVPSYCSSPVGYANLTPGAHRFEVSAYDALGRHGDPVPAFGWTILTPAEAVRALMQKVRSMGLSSGTTSSLLDPLLVSDKFLSNNRPSDDYKACRQLRAFIDQVNLYERKGRISSEEALSLRLDTTEIVIALGCP